MPNRILREGILTSRRVDRLSERGELYYRRQMSKLDDHGRFEADPELIISACYPLRAKKVRVAHIKEWMKECQAACLLITYAANGKAYLQYLDWRQQERSESKCPPPPKQLIADAEQGKANEHLVVFEGVYVGTYSSTSTKACTEGRSAAPANGRKTQIPAGFSVSERVKAWAAEKGHENLEQHFEFFVGKAKAKGYAYVDWDEALMGAIRDNWAKLPKHGKDKGNDLRKGVGHDGRF